MKRIKKYILNSDLIEWKLLRKFIGGKWVKLKTKYDFGMFSNLEFWIDYNSYCNSSIFDNLEVMGFENYN